MQIDLRFCAYLEVNSSIKVNYCKAGPYFLKMYSRRIVPAKAKHLKIEQFKGKMKWNITEAIMLDYCI